MTKRFYPTIPQRARKFSKKPHMSPQIPFLTVCAVDDSFTGIDLKSMFKIDNIHSDTHMRTLLHNVSPQELRAIFNGQTEKACPSLRRRVAPYFSPHPRSE